MPSSSFSSSSSSPPNHHDHQRNSVNTHEDYDHLHSRESLETPPPYGIHWPKAPPPQKEQEEKKNPKLKRIRLPTLLTIPFLALLIVPWVATVKLNQKPFSSSSNGTTSYEEPAIIQGKYTESELEAIPKWITAIRTLNVLAAVLTVPVISALLSQAAVVLAQRGSRIGGMNLSVTGLLSLADAPWTRLDVRTKYGKGLMFVRLGFALMVVSMLQIILQFALVDYKPVRVASDYDIPSSYISGYDTDRYYTIGFDPEPKQLSLLYGSYVSRRAAQAMNAEAENEVHSTFWTSSDDIAMNGTVYYWSFGNKTAAPDFISSIPVGTNTGVLRYHALRFNSSVTCTAADAFPASCEGDLPFEGDYPIYVQEQEAVSVRWCVPGNYTQHPWSLSRSRQDITEDMWLSVTVSDQLKHWRDVSRSSVFEANFTTHCTVSSTRGYFELPSSSNGNTRGPLLETWPDKEGLEGVFNDAVKSDHFRDPVAPSDVDDYSFVFDGSYDYPISPVQPDPFLSRGTDSFQAERVPGPLTLTALTMLGNGSWFDTLLRSNATSPSPPQSLTTLALTTLCGTSSSLPFLSTGRGTTFGMTTDRFYGEGHGCDSLLSNGHLGNIEQPDDKLAQVANQWFHGFYFPEDGSAESISVSRDEVQGTLSRAVAVATEAMVKEGTAGAPGDSTAEWAWREIHRSEGKEVVKPEIGMKEQVVIWIFLGLEILGIAALVIAAVFGGTFVGRLDAGVLASVGAQLVGSLGDAVPSLGKGKAEWGREEWIEGLREKDGKIGRVGSGGSDGERNVGDEEGRESHEMSSLTPTEEHPSAGFGGLRIGTLAVGGKGKIA